MDFFIQQLVNGVTLGSLYALLAIRGGGLLVHAAGLRVNQVVHLFIGPSGSGKTTVVALSPEAAALNDDLIIVRPAEHGWLAYATPFWNLETHQQPNSGAGVPIAGIYRLVQDRNVYLESVSAASAVADLVANCPVVNGAPAWLPALLDRCRQLARDVPVWRLHFRKDPGFWDLIGNMPRGQ